MHRSCSIVREQCAYKLVVAMFVLCPSPRRSGGGGGCGREAEEKGFGVVDRDDGSDPTWQTNVDVLNAMGGWTLEEAMDVAKKQRRRDLEWWRETMTATLLGKRMSITST
ncbi:hypothetical protein LWI29_012344 [Acer saccharum]|uniref:Uncharacterized protein n=1 Tax=Acer saccharum TaxID=4024 RepID=A0AA39VQK9_ACESA|nr:hypothetical protein LWI29_012344 [Acer saccharum]